MTKKKGPRGGKQPGQKASGDTSPRGKHPSVPEWNDDGDGALAWLIRGWRTLWYAPTRAERLVFFQRVFTFTFLLYLFGWTSAATEWLTVRGFHLSAAATSPAYPAPFPALPEMWLAPFLVLLFGATVLVILDVGGRPMKALLCFLAVYVQMVDQPSSFTLNKVYVVFFFVLAVAPKPTMVRVDTPAVGDDDEKPGAAPPYLLAPYMPAWPIRLIQATLLIQYCTAGICKAAWGDWLFRTDVLYTHTVGIYRTEIAGWVVHHMPDFGWAVFGWGALLFELGAPIVFIVKKLRPVGIVWGIGFHGGVAVLMKDLIFFSQQMISVYLLFIDEKYPVRAEAWLAEVTAPVRSRLRRLVPGRGD